MLQTEFLDKLERATRFPSILALHRMDQKGRLLPERQVQFEDDEELFFTEKLDGVNVRLILLPCGRRYVGSRKQILYCVGDEVYNPVQGVVEHLSKLFPAWFKNSYAEQQPPPDGWYGDHFVLFGELYGAEHDGAGVPSPASAKQYGQPGFRAFAVERRGEEGDALPLPFPLIPFKNSDVGTAPVGRLAHHLFSGVARVPSLQPSAEFQAAVRHGSVQDLLPHLEFETQVETAPGAWRHAEGVIVRNADGTKIAKLRVEDYRRACR